MKTTKIYLTTILLISIWCCSSPPSPENAKYNEETFDSRINILLNEGEIDSFLFLRLKYMHFELKEYNYTNSLENLSFYQVIDKLNRPVPKHSPKHLSNVNYELFIDKDLEKKNSLCYNLTFKNKARKDIKSLKVNFDINDFEGQHLSRITHTFEGKSTPIKIKSCSDTSILLPSFYGRRKTYFLLKAFTLEKIIKYSTFNIHNLEIIYTDNDTLLHKW